MIKEYSAERELLDENKDAMQMRISEIERQRNELAIEIALNPNNHSVTEIARVARILAELCQQYKNQSIDLLLEKQSRMVFKTDHEAEISNVIVAVATACRKIALRHVRTDDPATTVASAIANEIREKYGLQTIGGKELVCATPGCPGGERGILTDGFCEPCRVARAKVQRFYEVTDSRSPRPVMRDELGD